MPTCIKRRAKKTAFAKGSFRWTRKEKTRKGTVRHLVACPKGYWDPAYGGMCDTSTRIYETVISTDKKRCPRGYREKR